MVLGRGQGGAPLRPPQPTAPARRQRGGMRWRHRHQGPDIAIIVVRAGPPACFFAPRAYLPPPNNRQARPAGLPAQSRHHPTRSPARALTRCADPFDLEAALVRDGERRPNRKDAHHDPDHRHHRPRRAAASRRPPPPAPLAARRRRPLRPPDQALEPEDAPVHLRRAQRHPHHRPRPDGAPLQARVQLRRRDGRAAAATSCWSAPSARRRRSSRKRRRARAATSSSTAGSAARSRTSAPSSRASSACASSSA